jgi:hypothetical protein
VWLATQSRTPVLPDGLAAASKGGTGAKPRLAGTPHAVLGGRLRRRVLAVLCYFRNVSHTTMWEPPSCTPNEVSER